MEVLSLYVLAPLSALALSLLLGSVHRRWRQLNERERFFLTMKEITTPQRMSPDEKARLRILRAPWWAAWRWLPDRWNSTPL